MKFKKLFPLIDTTYIVVRSDFDDRPIIDGRPEIVPWDAVERIKNRRVLRIFSYDQEGYKPGSTIEVIVEDEQEEQA